MRTAVWADDTPMTFLPNGFYFYRVAGVKTGSDGNIGMPELQLVQYSWEKDAGGIVRAAATDTGVEERVFLKDLVADGGFEVLPMTAGGKSYTAQGDGPLRFCVNLTCQKGIRAGTDIALFSRFMSLPGREARAANWYANYRVHPSESGAIQVLADYKAAIVPTKIGDFDQLLDSGLAMGSPGLIRVAK